MSRACVLNVSNNFHAHYRRVEYAMDTFGARFRQGTPVYATCAFPFYEILLQAIIIAIAAFVEKVCIQKISHNTNMAKQRNKVKILLILPQQK